MEQLYVFGTGNAAVTRCYNTCFALRNDNDYFLVDAGGGNRILTILEDMNVPLTGIHHIFATHQHTDHILGMIWVIRMIGQQMIKGKYEGDLSIYCHTELKDTIVSLCTMTLQEKITRLFDNRIHFVIIHDNETKKILDWDVTFFDIKSTKAKQFGFTAVLHNGEKLFFAGDEPFKEECMELVKGSQWLLHEAFCLYKDRERFQPYEKHHSTVKDACQLAESLQIPNLILWHTEDKNLKNRKEWYMEEGASYYHGNLMIPDDGDIIDFSKQA